MLAKCQFIGTTIIEGHNCNLSDSLLIQLLNNGIEIEFLGLKRVQLPESVTQTVFERMTSERKVLANKSQYEGEAEAQKIRSAADRKSAEMLANAESEATRIRGEGQAEAAKSLTVFKQNPELANFIFRLDALEKSGASIARLPFSVRILLENLLRHEDGRSVTVDDLKAPLLAAVGEGVHALDAVDRFLRRRAVALRVQQGDG